MTAQALDHVNLVTANLSAIQTFYTEVIGLEVGDRPPFPFPGAWLYCNGQAVVHLVGKTPTSDDIAETAPQIDHFAFRAAGLPAFIRKLEDRGIAYQTAVVPGRGILQIFLRDPDGNKVEMDFSEAEAQAHNKERTGG